MKRPLLSLLVIAVGIGLGAGLWAGLWDGAWQAEPSAEPLPLRPYEWAWVQRMAPHGTAAPDAYRAAQAQAQTLRAAAKRGTPGGTWDFAGPGNIGGRIAALAVHPGAPETIYAGAATGGVFKSTNRGDTWTPVFDDQPTLTIGAIEIDPGDPETVYVGTGEPNGGSFNLPGLGVFKTTDGGATWASLGLENTGTISRVRVHPTNPNRVYVAAVGAYFGPSPDRGLYRSDDAGATWDRVLFVNDSTGVIDLVMRPDDPDVLFAATWQRSRRLSGSFLFGTESGIWKSEDGGDNWARLGPTHGLPDPAQRLDAETGEPRFGRIGLALCRDQPDVMYALWNDGRSYSASSINDGYIGLYRSNDGGQTWFDFDPERKIVNDPDRSPVLFRFAWFLGQVRVHPEDPDHVYVLDVDLVRTTDGGQTWSHQGGTHVDHHDLFFAPDDPSIVVEGNDGGVAISYNGGRAWDRTGDLPVTQVYDSAIDPSAPERLYAGTQDNGTVRTRSGNLFDWERLPNSGDSFEVIVDPTAPNTVYFMRQFGLLVRDLSSLFSPFPLPFVAGIDDADPRNLDTPLAMDPISSKTLYYGTHRVWRITDPADPWEPVSPVLTRQDDALPLLGTLTSIAIAPTDPDVIYAATDDGLVWVTTDWAATWTNITGPAFPLRWITRVVVDPRDPAIAYVTFSGLKWKDPVPHVFRTRDFGQTWTDITANLPDAPVNALAVDPDMPGVLYLGSDVGVFVSLDDGGAWEALGDGLPTVPIFDLDFDADLRFLVAATHGRAMYTLDLANFAVATDTPPTPTAFALDAPFPNPSAAATTVPFTLGDPGTVRLAVFDLLGREVRMLASGAYAAGRHAAVWDGRDASGRSVAAGRYVLRLTGPGGTATQLVTRTR